LSCDAVSPSRTACAPFGRAAPASAAVLHMILRERSRGCRATSGCTGGRGGMAPGEDRRERATVVTGAAQSRVCSVRACGVSVRDHGVGQRQACYASGEGRKSGRCDIMM